MLQKLQSAVVPWLVKFFRGCLALHHIPDSWRRARVVFIPKAGRRGHEAAKDFRPICLTSFVLKTLERILDVHLRQTLVEKQLSSSQHAYLKGRSTETALHEVVRTIEHSLQYKQFTLAAFLDIEGAFNNVRTEAIQEALSALGVEEGLSDWLVTLLRSRIIQSDLGNSQLTRFVCRGTPQGGVISPLLWLLVMNKILTSLDRDRIKVVAYADDLVVLVSGLFPSVLSDIMQGALVRVDAWAKSCGLGVNPSKTELMLFTARSKIPNFRLPILNGHTLTLSAQAKYLGVVLDTKLRWRLNIDNRIRKACIAFYACKRAFGRRWGLQPRMVWWMYKVVVRPILTYGALVWWPCLDKGYIRSKMGRVQRTACVGVTGAMRSCPTDALNVLLHLLPIELHIKYLASCSAVRLKETGCWKAKPYGHSNILDQLPKELADCPTDYIVPRQPGGKNFSVRLPAREEWGGSDVTQTFDHIIFTDGSKSVNGVGAGIFSEALAVEESYRLPTQASVFQAEIFAIMKACDVLADLIPSQNTAILSDSQAAIKALDSVCVSSKLVARCRERLAVVGQRHSVTLLWVPAHRNIDGNERADVLARIGASLDAPLEELVCAPLGAVKRGIWLNFLSIADRSWANLETCRTSRTTWPAYSHNRTLELLKRSRADIARVVAVLTGHWPIGEHAARLGIPFNNHCRSCKDQDEKETLSHFVCNCPALAGVRYRALGDYFFDDINILSTARIREIVLFLNSTGWL